MTRLKPKLESGVEDCDRGYRPSPAGAVPRGGELGTGQYGADAHTFTLG